MDYGAMEAAFFAPRAADAPPPGAPGDSSPARALRDAVEPLATVSVWAEPSYDAYARPGLDFLTGYVWGRACALGEPDGSVVAAAFGVFEPGLVQTLYDAARAACSRAEVRAAALEGATEPLRQALGGEPDGLADVVAAPVAPGRPRSPRRHEQRPPCRGRRTGEEPV